MSIEIYEKAKIIHKDGIFYYLVKHHSKNDSICGGQIIIDENFNNKYIKRNSRTGHWTIQAHGTDSARESDRIAKTFLNCPTSYMYGQIRFGNKKNIALYFAKNRNKWTDWSELNETQQRNLDGIISWYMRPDNKKYQCDLNNITADKSIRAIHSYCDNEDIRLKNSYIEYAGQYYWNLDNL